MMITLFVSSILICCVCFLCLRIVKSWTRHEYSKQQKKITDSFEKMEKLVKIMEERQSILQQLAEFGPIEDLESKVSNKRAELELRKEQLLNANSNKLSKAYAERKESLLAQIDALDKEFAAACRSLEDMREVMSF